MDTGSTVTDATAAGEPPPQSSSTTNVAPGDVTWSARSGKGRDERSEGASNTGNEEALSKPLNTGTRETGGGAKEAAAEAALKKGDTVEWAPKGTSTRRENTPSTRAVHPTTAPPGAAAALRKEVASTPSGAAVASTSTRGASFDSVAQAPPPRARGTEDAPRDSAQPQRATGRREG